MLLYDLFNTNYNDGATVNAVDKMMKHQKLEQT